MARFLHTGDWQLGMTRHFLTGEAQGRFTDDRYAAVREILELARRESCACVVVCGDVFETNQVSRQTVLRALDVLRGSAVPVVLLPGNHDPLDAASVFRSRAFKEHCPAQVRVIQNSEPFAVAPGFEIVGAPWTSKRPLGDLVVAAAPQNAPLPGTVRVLVGHGALDTLSPPPLPAVCGEEPQDAGRSWFGAEELDGCRSQVGRAAWREGAERRPGRGSGMGASRGLARPGVRSGAWRQQRAGPARCQNARVNKR